jgi:hypothetical protein
MASLLVIKEFFRQEKTSRATDTTTRIGILFMNDINRAAFRFAVTGVRPPP